LKIAAAVLVSTIFLLNSVTTLPPRKIASNFTFRKRFQRFVTKLQ
jgi:hypothetical protein